MLDKEGRKEGQEGGPGERKLHIMSMQCNNCGILKLFIVYRKCKFNWESYILSGSPIQGCPSPLELPWERSWEVFKSSLKLNSSCSRLLVSMCCLFSVICFHFERSNLVWWKSREPGSEIRICHLEIRGCWESHFLSRWLVSSSRNHGFSCLFQKIAVGNKFIQVNYLAGYQPINSAQVIHVSPFPFLLLVWTETPVSVKFIE